MLSFNFYESVPKKPIEECKTLSVVITKDESPYCWVVYPNFLYRRDNLGLTPAQIQANNEKAEKERKLAIEMAKRIVKLGNQSRLDKKLFNGKQIRIVRALELLKNY